MVIQLDKLYWIPKEDPVLLEWTQKDGNEYLPPKVLVKVQVIFALWSQTLQESYAQLKRPINFSNRS